MLEDLQAKRTEIETQFEQKKAAREDAISQAASLFEEMNQLKGAYAIVNELIERETKVDAPKPSKEKK